MNFRFLTNQFYNDYKHCSEMEKKQNRPYASLCLIEFDNLCFAIPIRHNIKHRHAIFTNKEKTQGLDLSKTIIITNKEKYIDNTRISYISNEEYNILIKKEYFIKQKLKTYINLYKKAYANKHIPRNKNLCEKSTLQYFHNELIID